MVIGSTLIVPVTLVSRQRRRVCPLVYEFVRWTEEDSAALLAINEHLRIPVCAGAKRGIYAERVFLKIRQVKSQTYEHLMKIAFAMRGPGGILRLGKRRQQKSGQNGDDRYHHQQLNQSKSSFKGSRPITRWHVESSFLSGFSGGLGRPDGSIVRGDFIYAKGVSRRGTNLT